MIRKAEVFIQGHIHFFLVASPATSFFRVQYGALKVRGWSSLALNQNGFGNLLGEFLEERELGRKKELFRGSETLDQGGI